MSASHSSGLWRIEGHRYDPWSWGNYVELGTRSLPTNQWNWIRNVIVDGVFTAYFSDNGVDFTPIGVVDTKTHPDFEGYRYDHGCPGFRLWHSDFGGYMLIDDITVTKVIKLPEGDINQDGVVDYADLAILASKWLKGIEELN